MSSAFPNQIAASFAFGHQQIRGLSAAYSSVEVAFGRRLLIRQRIAENEHCSVRFVSKTLLHNEMLDELGQSGEFVAALADLVAVAVVLDLDMLEVVAASHRQRITINSAL